MAASARKASNPEIGAIAQFEHVNFRVPEHESAMLFFCAGLGFTRDPTRMVGTRNMWVNAGRQQFHLPRGEAVPFPGTVGVSVPDLAETKRSLERIAPMLKGSQFSAKPNGKSIAVTSPWGHKLRVHQAGELSGRLPQAISYVEFEVPVGATKSIAAFYEKFLFAPAWTSKRGKRAVASVTVGANQCFHFVETPDFRPVEHPNHVAVYVARYQEMYQQFKEKKLVMQPDANEQFRIDRMADPKTGKIVFTFEHEVRSLYHPDFLKPLVNRVPVPYLVD